MHKLPGHSFSNGSSDPRPPGVHNTSIRGNSRVIVYIRYPCHSIQPQGLLTSEANDLPSRSALPTRTQLGAETEPEEARMYKYKWECLLSPEKKKEDPPALRRQVGFGAVEFQRHPNSVPVPHTHAHMSTPAGCDRSHRAATAGSLCPIYR